MASVQDRLKIKRESCDTWSTREQLCLASSVLKSGDQNWISVSRSLKPFAEKEALRPPDWFSQKSCAVQYALLLENADTPKRKKRESGETTGESIVRRLRQERIAELGQILAFQRDEYQQLKAEVNLLKSATVTDEKLQKMWVSIEQEEREQEQKARAHSAWLAKRQQKLDVPPPPPPPPPQKTTLSTPKKIPESSNDAHESVDSSNGSEEDKKNRSGQTALLTSLLTSPSPTTQIQNTTSTAQVTSPTIASLLGSNTKIHTTQPSPRMSPQLHQLVTSAMSTPTTERPSAGAPTLSMLLALPANLSRGTLSTIQTTNIQTPVADVITTPSRLLANKQITQNTPTVRASVDSPTTEIPETDSMVQIIDHIDDVIGKDKITEVIDKDEINEIIGDIEELIKEEITGNPQTTASTPPVIAIPSAPIEKPLQVLERPVSRDIDETVSLSSSPDSEMAIEDIDQSTSNIAEIIGTAIDAAEPKVIVKKEPENEPPEIPIIKCKEKENVNDGLEMETEEEASVPDNNETVLQEEQKAIENKAIVEGSAESMDQIATPEDKVCDRKIEVEKEAKQEPEEIPVASGEPEKIIPERNEPEKINEEAPVESKEEEITKIVEKVEDDAEIEEKSPILESIEAKPENFEIDEHDEPPEITREEGSTPEQFVDTSESGELKEEIYENKEILVEHDDISKDIEKHVKSPQMSKDAKEEESEETEESSTKEEIDSKIEESSSVISTPTMPTESDETPDKKTEDIPTPKPEVEDEIVETDTKVEDLIVKEELLEENSDTAEEMKVEEVESLESVEVKDVKDIIESKEIKKAKDVKPIKEVEEGKEVIMEVAEMVNKVEQVKETKEIQETEELREEELKVKEVNDLIEVKDAKETKETRIEKAEKTDKVEKSGKDDDSKRKKEDELLEIKKEEPTTSAVEDTEMEEEESSLTKLSAGRAMKTYSKKQNVAIDSEPETENSGEGADYRAWKKAVMLVYNRLATHKYASVFLRPITEDQAPGYHSVIFRPMDLSTIKKNIDNGTIRSTMHFQRDVMLMFQNAIMYNKHDTFVYQMAVSMQEECLQHMQILVEVTGEGPFRRETRTAASSSSETNDSNAIKRKRSHITPSPHDTESPRMKKRRKSEND